MSKKSENYLVISDTQIPFHAGKALDFCKYLKKTFNVSDENVYHVGDELDQYFGSQWKRHPDMRHSAVTEIRDSIDELKRWYLAFPRCKVAISNHMLRWMNKAVESEIPSVLMRKYQEVIEAPKAWVWADEWLIKAEKMPFRVIHGLGYSGERGHIQASLDKSISTVIGHLHSFGGIAHVRMINNVKIWAANAGCLIDTEAHAFHYGRYQRRQPTLGAVVVLNGGTMPVFVPYDT